MNTAAPFESDPTQRKKAVHVKVSISVFAHLSKSLFDSQVKGFKSKTFVFQRELAWALNSIKSQKAMFLYVLPFSLILPQILLGLVGGQNYCAWYFSCCRSRRKMRPCEGTYPCMAQYYAPQAITRVGDAGTRTPRRPSC